ncbi:hypothetical protein NVS89_00770 [Ancylobacter sp. MQZ15Z-1]|uniref:Porin n=1 Tax=Ancylobacter mangrovi TaxID=2972472 RepID=A0A9X2T099_9HYPH|nr:hypothetical protein [Ancylobacter mangrovi]MCS0493610.1 hypothetical protein [Ancylobacter mangrovi]
MKKLSPIMIAATLALTGLLALPYVSVADATDNGQAKVPQGYRTCFMQERAVFTGTPRMEKVPHCVFAR